MVFVVLLFLISYTSAKLTSGEVTGGGDTINNYINQTGGNTTEEMQDAVGSGFTGNLSYNDGGNSFDVNGGNILTWLNGFYRKLVDLITTSDIQDGTIRDVDLNLTNITLNDFTNDANYVNSTTLNNGSYLNVAETDPLAYNGTLALNSSLSSYRTLSNMTFTNSVNITNSNLSINQGNFICLNYECSQWIKANSTGVFIQG